MKVAAFDAKEYNRPVKVETPDPSDETKTILADKGFHTQIGVGVRIKDAAIFGKVIRELFTKVCQRHKLTGPRAFYPSWELRRRVQPIGKAVACAYELIDAVSPYIDLLHVTYAIFPPSKVPSIQTGGYKTPQVEVETNRFLRNLGPMFSPIVAWTFAKQFGKVDGGMHIDHFIAKQNRAWDELISIQTPTVIPRGDECDAAICVADVFAFVTDHKLYAAGKKLFPDDVKEIWKDSPFETSVRFVDSKNETKIAWYSDLHVDTTPFLPRPMVFLLADVPDLLSSQQQTLAVAGGEQPAAKPFRQAMKQGPAFDIAVRYAQDLGGGFQIFDQNKDSGKIRDGDKLLYIGLRAKEAAETFGTVYSLDVQSIKDLREHYRAKGVDS